MEAKFFRPFWILHLVEKQAYKIEFSNKYKIYDVFHILLLEQNTTRKRRVDKNIKQMDFNVCDNISRKYEVEAIQDSAVYTKESEARHLLRLYYLVFWKNYSKKENTWKLYLPMQHLRKLISLFHKEHLDKPIAIFEAINITSPIARLMISSTTKSIK